MNEKTQPENLLKSGQIGFWLSTDSRYGQSPTGCHDYANKMVGGGGWRRRRHIPQISTCCWSRKRVSRQPSALWCAKPPITATLGQERPLLGWERLGLGLYFFFFFVLLYITRVSKPIRGGFVGPLSWHSEKDCVWGLFDLFDLLFWELTSIITNRRRRANVSFVHFGPNKAF